MSAVRKKAGRWETQLNEICSLLGFYVGEKWGCDGITHTSRVVLKCGRAHVMRKKPDGLPGFFWQGREDAVMSSKRIDASMDFEGACRDVVKTLSGAELIVRATEGKRPSKWGFTRVRTERHIRLPEFSSAAELRLKLEVSE